VHRAPTEELQALVPYVIVLVDADEGFRLMAHGTDGLEIGDAVTGRLREFAGRLLPYFERRVA
jgi:uncharacterized OB-fold protein